MSQAWILSPQLLGTPSELGRSIAISAYPNLTQGHNMDIREA